ncbi:hypothetical protein KAI54_00665 [Candidatus Gracilibacteria bacterium]|nr:hypothetical protein [Candidatus Gracilibacteria bacterium]
MFRKIFITFAVGFLAFASVSAVEDSTTVSTDVDETAAVEKSLPPELIGGSLLPGTSEGVKEAVKNQEGEDLNTAEKKLQWLQTTFIRNVISQLIGWTAALAVVFLIFGGYQYLTSVGNDEQIKSAHKTITWSLAGLLLALLAFAIVQILVNIKFDTAPSSNLLAADVSQILPLTEEGWDKIGEIANLPRGDFKTEFLPVVARFLIYGMAFVAFLVFFVAGAWLVVGWGNDESVKKAKNAIIWGVVGLAFAAASYALVKGLLGVDLSWEEEVAEVVDVETVEEGTVEIEDEKEDKE